MGNIIAQPSSGLSRDALLGTGRSRTSADIPKATLFFSAVFLKVCFGFLSVSGNDSAITMFKCKNGITEGKFLTLFITYTFGN